MNELLEPFVRMLESIAAPAAVRAVEQGGSADAMWAEIASSGFLDALVSEEQGGAGLSLAEVEPIFGALGAHAVPLPVGETMIARALLAHAGVAAPDGPIALATSAVSGQVVPCGLVASYVLLDRGDALMLVAAADLQVAPLGIHGALAARISWQDALSGAVLARPAYGLRPVAAALRAALIAGCAGQLCTMTSTYANERVQFGKPIGRQQALQQNLAVMAEDMIAARIAAQLGCAGGLDMSLAAAATAKATTSGIVPRFAATAHAVHGAIGVAEEYDLQLLTRRLHEWRLADGSEGYWNELLGAKRLESDASTLDWVRAEVFA